jgi:hypothetical protein
MRNSLIAKTRLAGGEVCSLTPGERATLFSPAAVAVATYSGTPMAGFLLLALNYRRLGKSMRAAMAAAFGMTMTLLAVLCWLLLPYFWSALLCLILLVGTRLTAARLQGEAVAMHVSRGGRLASKWTAFAVGVVCLCALLLSLRVFVSFA